MTNLTVLNIIDLCEQQYQARYNIGRETILLYLNVVQQALFSRDLDAFLVWNEYITINQQLTFSVSGYTNAIAGDVGKTVIGTTSSATAKLISFNNTTKKWIVSPISGSILATENVTINTGTGAGTLTANDVYYGPYTAATTSAPVKRIFGVTTLTDAQMQSFMYPGNFSSLPGQGYNDYGLFKPVTANWLQKMQWISGKLDNLNNTYTFLQEPQMTVANTYRLVYYQDAPIIVNESDDTHLLIPDRFRYSIVQAIGKLAEESLYGSQQAITPDQALKPYMDAIWNYLDINNAETFGLNSDSISFSDNGWF